MISIETLQISMGIYATAFTLWLVILSNAVHKLTKRRVRTKSSKPKIEMTDKLQRDIIDIGKFFLRHKLGLPFSESQPKTLEKNEYSSKVEIESLKKKVIFLENENVHLKERASFDTLSQAPIIKTQAEQIIDLNSLNHDLKTENELLHSQLTDAHISRESKYKQAYNRLLSDLQLIGLDHHELEARALVKRAEKDLAQEKEMLSTIQNSHILSKEVTEFRKQKERELFGGES